MTVLTVGKVDPHFSGLLQWSNGPGEDRSHILKNIIYFNIAAMTPLA